MAKRNPPSFEFPDEPFVTDSRLAQLLDDIEREETPERLLKLARKLQEQLAFRKQRERPS